MFFVKQEKAMVEEKVGKKIPHDAQTMCVFSGRSIFRKNTSKLHIKVKDLERDSLKTIQADTPLGKPSCTSLSVHVTQLCGSCIRGSYTPLADC